MTAQRPAAASGERGERPDRAEIPEEAVAASGDAAAAHWPDEAAETAFRAEARERGENLQPGPAVVEAAEEAEAGALPELEELLPRIPPAVREALDDHFRAKFTGVKRVPAKALQSPGTP